METNICVHTHTHTYIYIYIYIHMFGPKRDKLIREWR
jgi:hypothetical protein